MEKGNGRSDTQLPLSKTCQNCFTAKVKCTKNDGSQNCVRCLRLGRGCTFPQARRRNNGTKKDMRVEALEAKVNQLLGASQNLASDSGSAEPSANDDSSRSSRPSPTIGYQWSDTLDHTNASQLAWSDLLDGDKADALLDTFKITMSSHFPFVVIPTHTRAEDLRQEKPFLFLTVMAAASFENLSLQRHLGKEVKTVISSRIIFNGEVSFELLQGLLIHVAWCQYHSRPRQFTQILQLAIGMVIDLRLDCPAESQSWTTALQFRPEVSVAESLNVRCWNHDEQRAVAGCFYLSSSVSLILQKSSIFPYTPYLDFCCTSLSRTKAHPGDRQLLCMVQLQNIMDKISRLTLKPGGGSSEPGPVLQLHVESLRSDLQFFRERVLLEKAEVYMPVIQFHTTELYLYQISLLNHNSGNDAAQPYHWVSWRLDILCAGLMSAKSLFDFYLSLPLRSETGWIDSQWVHMGFAVIVGVKLSISALSQPETHQASIIRNSLDMSEILDRIILRIGVLVNPQVDGIGDRDVFYHYDLRIRKIQAWFKSHLLQHSNISRDQGGSISNSTTDYAEQHFSDQRSSTVGTVNTSEPAVNEIIMDDLLMDFPTLDFDHDLNMDDLFGDWLSYPMPQF